MARQYRCQKCLAIMGSPHHDCPAPDPECWQGYSDSIKSQVARITSPSTRRVLEEMHDWLKDLTWQATRKKLS